MSSELSGDASGPVPNAVRDLPRDSRPPAPLPTLRSEKEANPDAEARLQQLETIIEVANMGVFEWPDVTQEHIYVSEPFLARLGYAPGDLPETRDGMASIVHPDDLDIVSENFRAGIETLGARHYEHRLRHADGHYGWFETRLRAYRRPTSGGVAVIATLANVDRRVALALERQALIAKLNLVLHAAGAGVYDWPDHTQSYLEISPSMQAMLGYGDDEIQHDIQFFWSLVHPDDHAGIEAELARTWAEPHTAYDATYRIRRKSGDYRTVRSMGRATAVNDAGAFRLTGAIFDVHEASESRRAVVALNEQLSQFSYLVAHDLLAPMRQLGSLAAIVVQDHGAQVGPDGQALLAKLSSVAEGGQRLIYDLLEYSRVGTAALRMERVDLNPILASLTEMLDLRREVSWELSPLPAVRGDRTQLTMLLQNLLANAIKFSRPRGAEALIRVAVEQASEADVEFRIDDNGVGFEPAFAERIFGAFERGHVDPRFEGNGIGLANCARIVARHDGRIRAEGHPGKGAIFFVQLPLAS